MPFIPLAARARLFEAASTIWDEHRARLEGRFSSFIPTDYPLAYESLAEVCDRGDTFVELGSGAGVVTVMADLLGLDAYGIEVDDWLVAQAQTLAEAHDSEARFVAGSFVPLAARDETLHLPADFLHEIDGVDAWRELGMTLRDFDIIYDYYWPEQAEQHEDLLVRFARRDAVLLRYSAEHGFECTTVGALRRRR